MMLARKTLIALGVSCTLGAGAAFAGSTPFPSSVNESAPWAANDNRITSMIVPDSRPQSSVGLTSSMDQTIALPTQVEQWDYYVLEPASSAEMSGTGATSSGGEFYVVGPTTSSEELYVLSPASEDYYVLSPNSYDVILFDNSSPAM